jgi:Rhodopirellula transposase DDE domain
VELIGHTKTSTGLTVRAAIDDATYPSGIKVSDDKLSQIKLRRHKFHGEWNYSISPSK